MSGGKSDADQPKLDLAEVRRLVNLMETKELAEVEIELEGKRVRVVRAGVGAATGVPVASVAAAAPAAPAVAPATESAAPAAPRGSEIPSPMVGTFYRSPSPDAAPFAEVGDRISKETVVCIIEAMKVNNEIKAELDGEIIELLVEDGQPVEYDQPLFRVRT